MLRITLVRSTIGRPADQGRTVASLGLRKLHATVERPDNPSIRGMVNKIHHLVRVEEVPASTSSSRHRTTRKSKVDAGTDA
ncbi:MAG: 50S ribosomal protein L30 [Thermomicrobiales bacterium]